MNHLIADSPKGSAQVQLGSTSFGQTFLLQLHVDEQTRNLIDWRRENVLEGHNVHHVFKFYLF